VTGGGGGDMVVEGVPGNKGIRGRGDPRLNGRGLNEWSLPKPAKT